MSNADYDVAYCDACERCHSDGICPKDRALANDANREMGLPDDEDWGNKWWRGGSGLYAKGHR